MPSRSWPTWRLAVLAGLALAGLAVVLVAGREAAALIPRFGDWLDSLGPWGPVAFIVAYGIAATCLFPCVTLTVAGGAMFGLTFGVLYVMLGVTLGAALAFLSGRHVARRFVEHLVTERPRLAAIDRAVEREGLKLVFLLRLSPAVPYTLLNYALGLSRVRFRDYILGTIGMTPTVTAYVYSGKVAGDLASLAAGAAPPRGTAYYAMLALGLLATVAVTIAITRMARRAIDEAVAAPNTGMQSEA